jgi:hypothetical protein
MGTQSGLNSKDTSGQASEEDAASEYGYAGILSSNSQEMSGQGRDEDAASVYGKIGTLGPNCQGTPWPGPVRMHQYSTSKPSVTVTKRRG